MSNLTVNYPYLVEIQINKKGRWSGQYSIRKDMSFEYALNSLKDSKDRSPQHNFRLIRREVIE